MIKIKKATTKDIPLIRDLTFKVWPQTYAAILTQRQIDYMLEMMYSESSLVNQMADGSHFILIYDDDQPVGFASYQEIKPTRWKLHKIYVLLSQQGKGTGKRMIDHIIDDIKKQKATSLELQVNIHNTAKGFYEKLGFAVRERIDLDIGDGFFMNDFIMEKRL